MLRAFAATVLAAFLAASPAFSADAPSVPGDELVEQAVAVLDADPRRARRLMEQAADAGNFLAMANLASFLQSGVGGPADAARARELLERAVAGGSSFAKATLARRLMYENNAAAQARAVRLAEEASADPKIQPLTDYTRGRLALFGVGRAKDEALGVDLLERSLAFDAANPDALFLVARAHQVGWGGRSQNPVKAYELFRKAGERGDERAQRYTGVALLTGEGAAQNPLEAYAWFRRAAEGGNRMAMVDVAVMLATGEGGVKADPREARTWYRRAAEMRSAHAMRGLGAMLAAGEGGRADRMTGRAYLELASEGGDENATEVMGALAIPAGTGDRARIEKIKADWIKAHGRPGAD